MTTIDHTVCDDDLRRIMREPDGPQIYREEFDMIVPSFIDPCTDLIPNTHHTQFKRLSYHVPFSMRGDYQLEWLPKQLIDSGDLKTVRTDTKGFVLCRDTNREGNACGSKAVNRSGLCRNHGGALHPADKSMSGENVSIGKVDPDRVANLDRVTQVIQQLIPIHDLSDEEILGAYIFNSEGRKISTVQLGPRVHQLLTKELFRRMNHMMSMELPAMISTMTEIAKSDLVEPADRIKAAVWVAERVMGKTPEVVILGKTETPYETIFETVESGSRDAYRTKSIESSRIVDAEVVEDPNEYSEPSSDDGDSGSDGDLSDGSDGRRSTDSSQILPGTSNDSGIRVDDPHGYAVSVIERRKKAKDLKDRIKKQTRRRFAARATGAKTLDSAPWLILWGAGPGPASRGELTARLITPQQQSEKMLDRIATNDSLTNVLTGASNG